MNLKEWAIANGVHPHATYRWFREGVLPVPTERVRPRTILVNVEARRPGQGVSAGGRSGRDHCGGGAQGPAWSRECGADRGGAVGDWSCLMRSRAISCGTWLRC
nr:hypothetical protein [Kibdelosporangium sp. MJ126-NF4]CTQ95283.1 hypothetical protein [Kibdelosporangium sp. MJ126-NF4]